MNDYVTHGSWAVIGSEVRRTAANPGAPGHAADVTVTILLQRRTLGHVISVLLPCVCLAGLSLLVFSLPPSAGEKVPLGMLAVITYALFALWLAGNVLTNSEYVPIIGENLHFIVLSAGMSL